jgi:hypothetical protein
MTFVGGSVKCDLPTVVGFLSALYLALVATFV